MKKLTHLGLLLVFFHSQLFSQVATEPSETAFSIGSLVGYNRGFGGQINATVFKPLSSLPVHLRVGIGYTSLNPGYSADARRIFINNAPIDGRHKLPFLM